MTIKTLVKEHFSQSPISRHLTKHLPNTEEIPVKNIDSGYINLELRKFSIEDTDECAELFMNVFSADPWYDEWLTIEQTRCYLNELIENPVFEGFIAYEDSKNIAAVCLGHKKSWWMGKEFIIDEFYVKNNKQGKGIGTILLDCIADYLTVEDYKRLILTTNKNIPAEKFYNKNEFYINQNKIIMIKEI
jgi:aminoglycoside 6'-N-acetyltransferase I